jgi:ElaB/YqjD/DUF883 family membrane-anchored ribosome-binding protein
MTLQKTAAELEHEVESQRAQLSQTLDRISARMTPGQVLDEAWEFAKDSGGGDFARNLGANVRDNPLPVGLITAGIAWLMSGRSGGLPRMPTPRMPKGSSRPRDRVVRGDPLDTSYDGYAGSGSTSGPDSDSPGLVKRAAGSVASATASAGERISRAAGTASDAAQIAMDDARESAENLRRSASENIRMFRDGASERSQKLRARAETFADEQPVVLAVAGLAIGALVGAIARSTAAESRFMGDASDRIKDRAMDAAASGVEQAAGVVERTYNAVRDEAEREGLTGDSAREAADELKRKVRKVAKKGKEQLEDELDSASGSPAQTG